MTSKLIVIIAASVATVIGMFIVGKLLDRSEAETETIPDGGAA